VQASNLITVQTTLPGGLDAALNSVQVWARCGVSLTGPLVTSGQGAVQLVDPLPVLGLGPSALAVDAATDSTAAYVGRYAAEDNGGGGATVPEFVDWFEVDTLGGNVAISLPVLTNTPDGRIITIKSINAAGDIAVTPDVAGQIDGLGLGVPYTIVAPLGVGYASKSFKCSRLLKRWLSFGG